MNSVVLRKNGGFFLSFNNDAIIIAYLSRLRLCAI